MLRWAFICTLFLVGLYFSLNYSSLQFQEGFATRCPDVLVQDGEELVLKNTKLAEIPGVNPVRFKNLEEYTQFMYWQQSQNIQCPVLYFQKTFDAQNEPIYMQRPPPVPPLSKHPDTDNPPYAMQTYPAMDPYNQDIGTYSLLNQYHNVGEQEVVSSDNAMDANWGGVEQQHTNINSGHYTGNYVQGRTGAMTRSVEQEVVSHNSTMDTNWGEVVSEVRNGGGEQQQPEKEVNDTGKPEGGKGQRNAGKGGKGQRNDGKPAEDKGRRNGGEGGQKPVAAEPPPKVPTASQLKKELKSSNKEK